MIVYWGQINVLQIISVGYRLYYAIEHTIESLLRAKFDHIKGHGMMGVAKLQTFGKFAAF